MQKKEKRLLMVLSLVIVAAGGFFAFQAIANPAPSPQEITLAKAGETYGETGHSETKLLLKTVASELSGEVDLSDEAQKHLYGEPRGCVLDETSNSLGGQWFISSWITSNAGDLKELSTKLQAANPELTVSELQKDFVLLEGPSAEAITAKRIDSDTFEVTLTSKCYGE